MSDSKESLYAQISLLNFLHGSGGERTVSEILDHLENHTAWGKRNLSARDPKRARRNVQNWLKGIRESAEFSRSIEWREDPDNKSRHRYKSLLPAVSERVMPIEEACVLLMAEELLDVMLPADYYRESLHDLFQEARKLINDYERKPKAYRQRVKDYLKRIAVAQRGQALAAMNVPYDILGCISRAILDGKCVDITYRGDERTVHPYGLVLKSPKIYLLAIDDHVMRKRHPGQLIPTQFLCARISKASVSERANRVPDDFDADKFIERQGLDAEICHETGGWERSFTLKLRLFDGDGDNLRDDLELFPLSKGQKIVPDGRTGNHLLTAPGVRASHQLLEWILGRLDRVEVLGPKRFRDYVADEIKRIHALYQ